jgi:hypothetical protein
VTACTGSREPNRPITSRFPAVRQCVLVLGNGDSCPALHPSALARPSWLLSLLLSANDQLGSHVGGGVHGCARTTPARKHRRRSRDCPPVTLRGSCIGHASGTPDLLIRRYLLGAVSVRERRSPMLGGRVRRALGWPSSVRIRRVRLPRMVPPASSCRKLAGSDSSGGPGRAHALPRTASCGEGYCPEGE